MVRRRVPSLQHFFWAGALAGGASALLNACYFLLYRGATGFSGAEPSLGSILVSSSFPPLLAALGLGVLARFTPRATSIFTLLTAGITLATFESIFRSTLPDGSPKPPGFDLLVMPMHVVVGGLAIALIPLLARRGERSLPAARGAAAGMASANARLEP